MKYPNSHGLFACDLQTILMRYSHHLRNFGWKTFGKAVQGALLLGVMSNSSPNVAMVSPTLMTIA